MLAARVDQLVLEFARKGPGDLRLLAQWDRAVGLGVIDVKTTEVEAADLVAARIRRRSTWCPPGGWSSTRTAACATCPPRWPGPSCARW